MLNRSKSRSSAIESRVRDRHAKGLCLSKVEIEVDGKKTIVDCDRKAGPRRGLCPHCYTIFRNERMRGDESDSLAYEDKMIREGLILGDREKLALSSGNLLRRRA